MNYEIECIGCAKVYIVQARVIDMNAWIHGTNVKYAFPYLSVDQRELLISNMCGDCFDTLLEGEDV